MAPHAINSSSKGIAAPVIEMSGVSVTAIQASGTSSMIVKRLISSRWQSLDVGNGVTPARNAERHEINVVQPRIDDADRPLGGPASSARADYVPALMAAPTINRRPCRREMPPAEVMRHAGRAILKPL